MTQIQLAGLQFTQCVITLQSSKLTTLESDSHSVINILPIKMTPTSVQENPKNN